MREILVHGEEEGYGQIPPYVGGPDGSVWAFFMHIRPHGASELIVTYVLANDISQSTVSSGADKQALNKFLTGQTWTMTLSEARERSVGADSVIPSHILHDVGSRWFLLNQFQLGADGQAQVTYARARRPNDEVGDGALETWTMPLLEAQERRLPEYTDWEVIPDVVELEKKIPRVLQVVIVWLYKEEDTFIFYADCICKYIRTPKGLYTYSFRYHDEDIGSKGGYIYLTLEQIHQAQEGKLGIPFPQYL